MTHVRIGGQNSDMTKHIRKGARSQLQGFNPASLPDLGLWIDSSRTTTIDDSTATPDVDSWTTRDTNATVFAQTSAAAKPHTGQFFNGKNWVNFDGSDDYIFTSDHTVITGESGSCFVVARWTSAPTSNGNLLSKADDSGAAVDQCAPFRIEYAEDSDPRFSIGARISNVTNSVRGSQTVQAGKAYAIYTESDGSTWTMRVNGVAETLTPNTGQNNIGTWFDDVVSPDNIAIGTIKRSGTSAFFSGLLGEIIIYNRVLSSSEIIKVENYLMQKWGVPR